MLGWLKSLFKKEKTMQPDYDALLIEQLKRHEGFRSAPYHDTEGHLTVGYGRALFKNPLTREEAAYLLSNDVQEAIQAAKRITPMWGSLSQERQLVLVNMVFQMGEAGVANFRKMFRALEAGDYDKAADEMLDSRWYIQTPNRAAELSEQMRTGVMRTSPA